GVRAYKAVNGTAIFRLKEHTDRLFNSARIFQMNMPYDKETVMEAHREVVRANKLVSCYIRPICFYGSEGMGIAAKGLSTHVAVAAWPWGAYLGGQREYVSRQISDDLHQLHPRASRSCQRRLR
ncbi:MAG: hypothetical protein RL358_1844, partial [Pseudomonadota bacterium]